ncbi:MAG: DNA-processing protein DprA [Candidatus Solibacter sp.]|nr:DNA-processing protein DprA [Candidatus Solibacter sp.]
MQLESTLTADTQAVLLLCGELGQRGGNSLKPLGLRQYNNLATWLKTEGLRPGDLLTSEGRIRLGGLQTAEVNPDRVSPLLERGTALALVVERWERSGLWVISRSDSCYPERLKRYLGQAAPPLLYGVGSKSLLSRGGLAVVGSRDRSEEDGEFARRVGKHCAKEGIAIISGAAKGIDRDAMTGALDVGGSALGVLAEGLARTATSGQYRAGLVSDHLTLVSPFDPDSRWFAYNAMERNKLLYGLGDAALVVASSADSGGTWAGATEAIQVGKVKVFVKSIGVLAPGNPKLVRMGGVPFPSEPWENLLSLFSAPEEKNGQLFSADAWQSVPAVEPGAEAAAAAPPDFPPTEKQMAPAETLAGESAPSAETEPTRDGYTLGINAVLALLQEPRSNEWLANKVCVRTAQMKDWLDRGVREGRILKLKKPVRYVAHTPTLFTE